MRLLVRVAGALAVLVLVFALGFFASMTNFGGLFGSGQVNLNVVTVLERVQAMSQLTTTRYTFSNIVEGSVDMPPILAGLYGQGLTLIAVGHIDAGVDLSQIGEDDIRQADGVVSIRLPPARLQNCFFDESASYVASRSTGVFARPLANLETTARRLALAKFRDDAVERGILDEARTRAEIVIGDLVNALVAEGVTVLITSAPPDTDAPLPSSCEG